MAEYKSKFKGLQIDNKLDSIPEVKQVTGTSEADVMSQNAVTTEINAIKIKSDIVKTDGTGTNFLADDGTYKTIATPENVVLSVNEKTPDVTGNVEIELEDILYDATDNAKTILDNKVNKELKTDSLTEYKVLSDNNFTDAEKEKIEDIPDISPSTDANNAYVLGTDGKPYVPTAEAGGVQSVNKDVGETLVDVDNTDSTNPKIKSTTALQTAVTNANSALQNTDLETHNSAVDSHADIRELIGDIEVPTKTSDLTNDSDFITSEDIPDISPSIDADNAYILGTDGKPYVPTASAGGVQSVNKETGETLVDVDNTDSTNPKIKSTATLQDAVDTANSALQQADLDSHNTDVTAHDGVFAAKNHNHYIDEILARDSEPVWTQGVNTLHDIDELSSVNSVIKISTGYVALGYQTSPEKAVIGLSSDGENWDWSPMIAGGSEVTTLGGTLLFDENTGKIVVHQDNQYVNGIIHFSDDNGVSWTLGDNTNRRFVSSTVWKNKIVGVNPTSKTQIVSANFVLPLNTFAVFLTMPQEIQRLQVLEDGRLCAIAENSERNFYVINEDGTYETHSVTGFSSNSYNLAFYDETWYAFNRTAGDADFFLTSTDGDNWVQSETKARQPVAGYNVGNGVLVDCLSNSIGEPFQVDFYTDFANFTTETFGTTTISPTSISTAYSYGGENSFVAFVGNPNRNSWVRQQFASALPIEAGGTGASTLEKAKKNLEIPNISPSTDANNVYVIGTDGKPYVPKSSTENIVKKFYAGTVTILSADWVHDSTNEVYKFEYTLIDLLETDDVYTDIKFNDDFAVAKNEKSEYAKIDMQKIENDKITWICFENKPEIDLNLSLAVYR